MSGEPEYPTEAFDRGKVLTAAQLKEVKSFRRYDDIDGGYFMAMITGDPEPSEAAVVPRDIVVVLDHSGRKRAGTIILATCIIMKEEKA